MPPSALGPAGTGYLVAPESGSGPGVLVLHAWWGLTPFFKRVCDRWPTRGSWRWPLICTATPARPICPTRRKRCWRRPTRTSRRTSSWPGSPRCARCPRRPTGRSASSGSRWAPRGRLWAAARAPDHVAAVVAFYGTQDIDFALATAAFQGHFAEHDEFVDEDAVAEMQAHLRLLGHEVDFHHYPGTGHWFFEDDRPAAYVERAADLAWGRTRDVPAPTSRHRVMTPSRSVRLPTLLVAAAVVAVTACSGSSGDSAHGSSARSTAPGSTPTSAARSSSTTPPPTRRPTTTGATVGYPSARDAADHLLGAWRTGDRNAALQGTDPAAVGPMFAIPWARWSTGVATPASSTRRAASTESAAAGCS